MSRDNNIKRFTVLFPAREALIKKVFDEIQVRSRGFFFVGVELKKGYRFPPEVDDGGGKYSELHYLCCLESELIGFYGFPGENRFRVTVPLEAIQSLSCAYQTNRGEM